MRLPAQVELRGLRDSVMRGAAEPAALPSEPAAQVALIDGKNV